VKINNWPFIYQELVYFTTSQPETWLCWQNGSRVTEALVALVANYYFYIRDGSLSTYKTIHSYNVTFWDETRLRWKQPKWPKCVQFKYKNILQVLSLCRNTEKLPCDHLLLGIYISFILPLMCLCTTCHCYLYNVHLYQCLCLILTFFHLFCPNTFAAAVALFPHKESESFTWFLSRRMHAVQIHSADRFHTAVIKAFSHFLLLYDVEDLQLLTSCL